MRKFDQFSEDNKLDYKIRNFINSMKKARLVEDCMSYEDLVLLDIFDEDEVTITLSRALLKERQHRFTLQKVKKMEQQLCALQKTTLKGMVAVMDTINSIEDRSKKMIFRPMDETANILDEVAEKIEDELNAIAEVHMDESAIYNPPSEDQLESDSSGNASENDEIN